MAKKQEFVVVVSREVWRGSSRTQALKTASAIRLDKKSRVIVLRRKT